MSTSNSGWPCPAVVAHWPDISFHRGPSTATRANVAFFPAHLSWGRYGTPTGQTGVVEPTAAHRQHGNEEGQAPSAWPFAGWDRTQELERDAFVPGRLGRRVVDGYAEV